MTTPDPHRRALLDDVLADSIGTSGLSQDAVLQLVRHEKAARRTRQSRMVAACGAALLLAVAIPVIRERSTTPEPPAPRVAVALPPVPPRPPAAPALKIERIDDQELLNLLDGQPVALVKLPDDQRRLLLVVHH